VIFELGFNAYWHFQFTLYQDLEHSKFTVLQLVFNLNLINLKMSLLNKISKLVSNSHQNLVKLFYYDPRIPELALVGAQMKLPEIQRDEIDLLDQSILWNTPKKRKTTEKRMKARYGMKEWGTWKPYVKNKKIRVDYITGEYFESGRLAPETYKKVMAETMEIQKKMKEAFSPFLPKDKELTGK